MNLDQMKKRDKIKKINALQNGPVAEFYAENGDRLVAEMSNDIVYLPSAFQGPADVRPPEIKPALEPPLQVICRSGWDAIDNAALLY